MTEFDRQLEAVAAARQQSRTDDERLYAVRLELEGVRARLQRAVRGRTTDGAAPSDDSAETRQRLAEAQASLAELRDELRAIEDWLARFASRQRALDELARSEATTSRVLARSRERLAAIAGKVRDEDEACALERQIDSAERSLANLTESRDQAAQAVEALRGEEQERRRRARWLRTQMESLRGSLRQTHDELVERLRPEPVDVDGLRRDEERLRASEERLRTGHAAGVDRLHDLIGGLYADPHPRSVIQWLNDSIPMLLLPMRIETIFTPGANGTELWVRIFPDEIAVQTHEPVLSAAEQEAGRLYWVEMAIAAHLRTKRERRQRDAWRSLVQLLSGPRAAWVAAQTKPGDWDAIVAMAGAETLFAFLDSADPNLVGELRTLAASTEARDALDQALAAGDGDAFIRVAESQKWEDRLNAAVRSLITGFPDADLTKTDAWTRAPRTRVLPDRFVLLLYRDAAGPPREIPGEPIPDVLMIGPDPLDPDSAFADDGDALTFGAGFDWMSNFPKAVEQGMGFRVGLSAEEAKAGFAKIQVLGVKASASAAAGATMVEDLIDSHQFSPKGFSIVRQGSPTNNSERDGSGYSDNDPYDDLSFFTQFDAPAFDPGDPDPRRSDTDGRQLADLLGIAYEPLLTVRNANGTDALEARAMSVALFPATLGYWLRNWMSPVVTRDTARLARRFFNQFVTGRGSLPAIRVGDQPYGILVTSDLSRWAYPEVHPDRRFVLFDEKTPFLDSLTALLKELQKSWSSIAATLPFAGRAGVDPSDLLMNVLGLQPTSAEFFQRIGYDTEYLRNLDSFMSRRRYRDELNSLIFNMPSTARQYLNQRGIEADLGDIARMKSLHVLWQHYVTDLDPPNLIEGQPLSEKDRLAFNYIEKLAAAPTFDKILNEDFGGPAPTSLLYLMLRNALLLQLHSGAYNWLEERTMFDPEVVSALGGTSLPNVRANAPSLSKVEIMSAKVSLAEPGHPLASATVADFIWSGFESGDEEARYSGEQKEALAVLAGTTTAALERAFVEHLDCCQYRLDAWETGLFTQRLSAARRAGSDDRATGLYVGGFGWLEQVKPAARQVAARGALPPKLRPDDQALILEEDDVAGPAGSPAGSRRGGFMHTPSLNHASAAALLRNAYLSHADPQRAEIFSVNLSSERVRRASFVLDGMRQGQSIEALLGYQFERGLHDRTSRSAARNENPVLELNRFIRPYRMAFPFEAHELPQAGDETVPDKAALYGVVDGIRLAAANLTPANGYGLSAVLAAEKWPGKDQGDAIIAERDALRDTLDAVKDLLTAENAYQLVQGNFDRVAAVSLAQKDARIPPSLQVVETPRGTEFSFTNRVTLHFDDLDPALAAANPWKFTMTPRAMAEPGLNAWLARLIGFEPAKILCDVKRGDGSDPRRVSLADLKLQPIDFIWLAGIQNEQDGGATEFETRIACHYRSTRGVPDDEIVTIGFSPAAGPGEAGFAQLFPLARQLRALLSESRALDARDFLPAPGSKASATVVDKANEQGFDLAELRSRVDLAFAALSALADDLDGPGAPGVDLVFLNEPDNATDDEAFSGPLGDAFDKLDEANLDFTDPNRLTVSMLLSDVSGITATLRGISAFGIADAFPPEAILNETTARAILARARRLARRLRNDKKEGLLDRAAALRAAAIAPASIAVQARLLLEAGALLFGETFRLLPVFTCANSIDLAASAADRTQLLKHALEASPGISETELVDEWLQALACVRPPLKRWDTVRVLADAMAGADLDMNPVQVPHRTADSWLAAHFPELDPTDPEKPFGIDSDTLSIVAHGKTAFQPGARQRGVLIDEWSEEIPTGSETTGISFRFNRPNAEPPQTLLLAVAPRQTGSWAWDDLVGILNDTLERAKRRAIEPAHLEQQDLIWNAFAPALVSEFSTIKEGDISLDLALVKDFRALTDFYSADLKG